MSFSEEISLKNEVSSEIIESIAEEDYNKNEGFIVKFNQAYEKWKFEHEMNVNSCILQKLDFPSIHSLLRESAQGKKFLATN
ncbi:hypothetical protein PVAND_014350 [Polypedilum vanderplanki]|uniref:Uncharacterized protein n=1 Tax=Polypedilum vanderplanki TaxID=319348 RepID=A0A9J6CTK1_POLVA|nr:hypothetical protein PVAND_014350 [Polypedilum vanderplanki]